MAKKDPKETCVAALLERVLLSAEGDCDVSETEAQAVVSLSSQIPEGVLSKLLMGLKGVRRRQLVMSLPMSRQQWWLETSTDTQSVGFVFAALPEAEQSRLLSTWFAANRDRYLLIKDLASQRMITVGDLWVRTDTAKPDLIQVEVETVLDAIQNETSGPSDFADFLKLRVTMYAPEVLESIGKLVVSAFLDLKIPIVTPASFLMHLKCHLYYDYLTSAIPGISIASYSQLIQQFVMALGQMPDGDWVMKVLSQMPGSALKHIFRIMREGAAAHQEPQRQTCLRLIRDIGQRVDRPEFEPVRLVYAA